ncbi:MAG: hypothetical protein JW888_17665 [Pirellulales bacterium]|nr:hypothetical protein [Pirellulales bacterium]
MKDIDFLPFEYRQQHGKRYLQFWRAVVVIVFVAILSVASLVQYYRLFRLRNEMAQTAIQHAAAKSQNAQLARLQSECKQATSDAELFTYLRHPWPRTQILAALLAPLPESTTLNQLEITNTSLRSGQGQRQRHRETENTDNSTASKYPAEYELELLRDQFDMAQVSVVLSGRTTDPAALHQYLADLDRCSLFAKAELGSLEILPNNEKISDGTMVFTAVVTVRPGYGQPGGPIGSLRMARTTTPRETSGHE